MRLMERGKVSQVDYFVEGSTGMYVGRFILDSSLASEPGYG